MIKSKFLHIQQSISIFSNCIIMLELLVLSFFITFNQFECKFVLRHIRNQLHRELWRKWTGNNCNSCLNHPEWKESKNFTLHFLGQIHDFLYYVLKLAIGSWLLLPDVYKKIGGFVKLSKYRQCPKIFEYFKNNRWSCV